MGFFRFEHFYIDVVQINLTKIELNIPYLRTLSGDNISELHLDQLNFIKEFDPALSPRPDLPEQLALESVNRLITFGVVY